MIYTIVFNILWSLFMNSGNPQLQQIAASMSPVQCMAISWDDQGRSTVEIVSVENCK